MKKGAVVAGRGKLRTPLRYPGGKRRLADFFADLLQLNGLTGCDWYEPFAGGCGLGLELLRRGLLSSVHFNDLDPRLGSFWRTVLENPEQLCEKIASVPVTMEERERQRALFLAKDTASLDLAFAYFFLNRTARSGIPLAGVIGGKHQDGPFKMDCRFNREDLCSRIRAIYRCREFISFTTGDYAKFLPQIKKGYRPFVFLDPPYLQQGEGLYHCPSDGCWHRELACRVRRLNNPLVLTVDDYPETREIYRGFSQKGFVASYSAHSHKQGEEIFISSRCWLPLLLQPISLLS